MITTSATTDNLLAGVSHVAVVSRDLDRLAAFYDEVFGVGLEALSSPRGRHGFLWLAPGTCLHVFEVPEAYTGPYPAEEMLRRGRLDHVALTARDESALDEIRRRLVARGASDGTVTRFGDQDLSVFLRDPDGMELEVTCPVDGTVFGPEDTEVHED